MAAPTFTWKGAVDREDGIAIFEYRDDLQSIEIPLPSFEAANNLNKFIQCIHEGGFLTGILHAKHVISNAFNTIKL